MTERNRSQHFLQTRSIRHVCCSQVTQNVREGHRLDFTVLLSPLQPSSALFSPLQPSSALFSSFGFGRSSGFASLPANASRDEKSAEKGKAPDKTFKEGPAKSLAYEPIGPALLPFFATFRLDLVSLPASFAGFCSLAHGKLHVSHTWKAACAPTQKKPRQQRISWQGNDLHCNDRSWHTNQRGSISSGYWS